MAIKAYSTHRPISIGCYPSGYEIEKIFNFDGRVYCEEVRREVWGYIVFSEDVPEDVLDRFELVTGPAVDPVFSSVLNALEKIYLRWGAGSRFDKAVMKAVAKGLSADDLLEALGKRIGCAI